MAFLIGFGLLTGFMYLIDSYMTAKFEKYNKTHVYKEDWRN